MLGRLKGLCAAVLLSLVACAEDDPADDGSDPGSDPPGVTGPTLPGETTPTTPTTPTSPTTPTYVEVDEANVTCGDELDCRDGEVCDNGVCGIARCIDDVHSDPPLGSWFGLVGEAELVVLGTDWWSGAHHLWKYDVDGNKLVDQGKDNLGPRQPLDVDAGDALAERPELIAMITGGTSEVTLIHPTEPAGVDPGFSGVAVEVADTDGNGVGEVVVVSGSGRWASCDVPSGACDGDTLSGYAVRDMAAGDVDGDGRDELVLAVTTVSDAAALLIVNAVVGPGEDPFELTEVQPEDLWRVAVGDVDGDGHEEIIGLHDSDAFDVFEDELTTWTREPDGTLTRLDRSSIGENELHDLDAADVDASGRVRVIVVTDDEEARVLTWADGGGWDRGNRVNIDEGDGAGRMAFVDLDGDAIRGELIDGPIMLPGAAVPLAVLHHGPYHTAHSDGASTVGYGSSEGSGQSDSQSISLGLSGTVGYSSGLVGGSLEASISSSSTRSVSSATTQTVATSFSVAASPETLGPQSAAVVLGWGCYHGFTYRVDDPAGLSGGADEEFVVSMPVGGGTTVWSSARYDAVIDAVGLGTPIDVGHTVGDAASYPADPSLPDGSLVPDDWMLFDDPVEVLTSDVATVSWSYTLAESTSTGVSEGLTVGASAGLSLFGFSFGASASSGETEGYTVTADASTTFSGSVPPVMDDPVTPEDEYLEHGYAFTPYVYTRPMESSAGVSTEVFVVGHTVR